MQDKTIQ
jgi:hypothetical protein